jgi:hypothetical protein
MPRLKQSEKYQPEREEICNKLLSIVGNEFYLCDIDADEEKQSILLLVVCLHLKKALTQSATI